MTIVVGGELEILLSGEKKCETKKKCAPDESPVEKLGQRCA
jgi:hypothetical protein